MRHLSAGRKLNRNSSHRIALARSQATALFRHGRIKTTLVKAKNLQPYVEKLITTKLMDDIAPAFQERKGGYTRIYRLGNRRGDAAQEAFIELVRDEA